MNQDKTPFWRFVPISNGKPSITIKEKKVNLAQIIRNVSEKETNRNLETTGGRGYENNGYSPEEDMSAEQMSGDSTFPKMSSSVNRPKQGLDMSPAPKVPYNRDNEALPSRTTAYPTKSRQIRNVTHV